MVQQAMSEEASRNILHLTATIVAAHVGRNQVAAEALPLLTQSVYRSLASAGEVAAVPVAQVPAVPVRMSMRADYLICLEDGKTLKRHLRTRHATTPEQYRAKWGLPADYPMTSTTGRVQRAKSSLYGRGPRPLIQRKTRRS